MNIKVGILLSLTAFVPVTSQAAIIGGWGVEASASSASNCPSYCTTAGGGQFAYDSSGAEFDTSALAVENSYGHGRSFASLSGSTYLPTLKVEASSNVGKMGSASAFAVQGYTYTGSSATTLTLNLSLHGSVTNSSLGYAWNRLSGSVAVISGSDMEWLPDFGTLVYELTPPADLLGVNDLSILDGFNVTETDSITFGVAPGQDFFVVAAMYAYAKNGAVDAWNTFDMSFTDDSHLMASSVSAVPIPAAVWLFGSGLVGLVGVSRSRQT